MAISVMRIPPLCRIGNNHAIVRNGGRKKLLSHENFSGKMQKIPGKSRT